MADDEATAVPMDESRVLGASIRLKSLGYQYGGFERVVVDDSVRKVDSVKGVENAGRHVRVEVAG